MIRQIRYEEGKRKLAEGIRQLCRALSCEGGILVNGAYSLSAMEVAKELEGKDLYLNQGIRLAAGAIAEINAVTGCGTREAAVFMEFLLSVCEKKDASGANPVSFARELKNAAFSIGEAIRAGSGPSARPLPEQLWDITNNRETAELILRGMEEGELVVKESVYSDTKLEITRGMRLEGPPAVGTAGTLKQMYVLVANRPLSSFMELYPVLQRLGNEGLFILADQIEGEALTLLNANVRQNRLRVWGMKAPGAGSRKEDILEDAAVLTGTRVFDGKFPCGFSEITLDMLGKAETVTVTSQYSVIGTGRNNPEIKKRIAGIRKRIDDPKTNYYDKQKLRERIAGLSGTAPVIYAGGNTLAQSREEKRRMEYAVAYAQTIQKYGIFRKADLKNIPAGPEAEQILLEGIKQSMAGQEASAWLLLLMLKKVCGLIAMWMTTGAVMVSTGYDREDLELIKSGVDIERLRG
ncbi:hypothetical protein [Clostridium sp. Marseille-P2415]|uniref:hypothetical protein n=1 Tax=Clostridium sp. Marseille-P2415 TaxID=1805471 RepID=UPI00098878BC|nr:hypothetical protein [Clostridium sp. Marseille-P2415]